MTAFLKKLTASLEPIIGVESLSGHGGHTGESESIEHRALLRLHRREVQRQINLERIMQLAAEEIQDDVSDDAVAVDWLNLFVDLAGDVADPSAQQIWARILALQIAVPDAVFKQTLAHLHRMDSWELEGFIEFCSFAFAFESGWRFIFEENVTRPEMWGYARGNDYLQHFINTGLLSSEVSIFRLSGGKTLRIRYYEKEYDLLADKTETGLTLAEPDVELGYRRFTTTGQQLTKALRAQTYYGYARNVMAKLTTEHQVQFKLLDDEGATAV